MEELIKEIYKINPYVKYKNKTFFDEKKVGSDVYGEVTQKGTNNLVKRFHKFFNEDTVFYDLGSGIGKMVSHIGLEYNIKKSVGIEYSKQRHKGAIDIKETYFPNNDNIIFLNDNFLNVDISDGNVVYCDNTVISDNIMVKVVDKISKDCLIILKKSLYNKEIEETFENDIVERTYNQNFITWFIKK